MRIQIINGPNINLLGKREPGIYGSTSFEDYLQTLRGRYPEVEIAYFQSNVEGEMINKIHEVGFTCDGIIMNAGAYTHYSYAIADAVECCGKPVVEVHLSDVENREDFRKKSVLTPVCAARFYGKKQGSYFDAIDWLTENK